MSAEYARDYNPLIYDAIQDGGVSWRDSGQTLIDLQLWGPDDNLNGMPDWWEQDYLSSTTNDAPEADADGDGYNNLAEFVSGTDPTNSFDMFGVDDYGTVTNTDLSIDPRFFKIGVQIWE